jgi:hypothetical protein
MLLCDAIREHLLLEFEYHGRNRVVAPYCHGTSTRGAEVLRAIQVAGSTRPGGLGFGKLWLVADIVAPRLTGQHFTPDDPHYNPNDRNMKRIHCRVE